MSPLPLFLVNLIEFIVSLFWYMSLLSPIDVVFGGFGLRFLLFLISPKLCRGEGNGTLLQYSCLKNPRDRGAWWATVHGVAKSQTRLSDFTFTFTNTTLAACAISVSLLLPTWLPLMLQKWRVDSLKLNDDENSDSSIRHHLIRPQGWWWEVHHCLQVGTSTLPR